MSLLGVPAVRRILTLRARSSAMSAGYARRIPIGVAFFEHKVSSNNVTQVGKFLAEPGVAGTIHMRFVHSSGHANHRGR
jgi:hypothetical protein